MGIHKVHPYLLLIADNSMLLLSYPSYPFPFSLTFPLFPAKLKGVWAIRYSLVAQGINCMCYLKHFVPEDRFG